MPPLTRNEAEVLLLVVSWVAGFLPLFLGRRGWTWPRAVGLALLLTPFVRMALGIYQSIDALFVYEVLPPIPRAALWSSVQTRILRDLVVPGIGLLLVARAVPRYHDRPVIHALREHGLAPKRSWRWDALRGSALFFAIAFAYLGALAVSRLVPSAAAGGDESQYWRNITVPLIVLVSATSGLTEELLFRGVMLTALFVGLRHLATRAKEGAMRRVAVAAAFPVAALAQAIVFGLIHAGYGTWTHVLAPAIFGLAMAWVARVLGVLPAALLHAQVNVLFFTFDVAPAYIAANGAWGAAALAALVLALAAASAYALWRTRADGVILLWRSLMGGMKEMPEPDAPAPRTG